MMTKSFISFSIFIFCQSIFGKISVNLDFEAILDKKANNSTWAALLHANKDQKTKIRSQAFFLTKLKKKTSIILKEELRASLGALQNPKTNLQFICRFPARAKWISENFGLEYLVDLKKCHILQQYLRDVEAESISYLFVGPYMANPASVMGHGVLRLRRKRDEHSVKDYTIGFAANVDKGINPLKYAYNGLLGGFYGRFSLTPFFNRITEYLKIENRPMWEYQLPFKEEEIRFVMLHLWEIREQDLFQYYFFDENCAYYLIDLLNLVSEKNLLEGLPAIVLPNRVPAYLRRHLKLEQNSYFPSYIEKTSFKYELLSQEEKSRFLNAIKTKEVESSFSGKEINALLEYLKLERVIKNKNYGPKTEEFFNNLIQKKIELGLPDETPPIGNKSDPSKAHGISRLSLGYERTSSVGNETLFRIRPFLHEFTEMDEGYVDNSEIYLLTPVFGYTENENLRLSKFTVISFNHIPPKIDFLSMNAFKLSLEMERASGLSRYQGQKSWEFNLMYGLSYSPFQKTRIYLGPKLSPSLKRYSDNKFNAFAGLEVGLLSAPTKRSKVTVFLNGNINQHQDLLYSSDLRIGLTPIRSIHIEVRHKWTYLKSDFFPNGETDNSSMLFLSYYL